MFIDTSSWQIGGLLPDNFKVETRHSRYTEMLPYWKKCRDARKGSKAIKDAGDTYLPRLESQELSNPASDKTSFEKNTAFNKYKDRAIWYGATGQTVETFVGMIFAKPLTYSANNKEIEKSLTQSDIIKYATQNDESFPALMKTCADEMLTVNRVGILEDFPELVDENGNVKQMTQLEFEKAGLTSYSVVYTAEQIINWGVTTHKGKKIESFYVLEENWLDYSESITKPEERKRWRILLLENLNGILMYKQVVVKATVEGNKVESITYPLKDGSPFEYIPFWVLSVYGNQIDVVREPEILDLVEMNIGHYRNSADYENEMHYVSIKTAIFPGWDSETYGNPVLGGALASPPEQTPFILEASGKSGIAEEMGKKEERMAILGAQMLANKGRYVQAAKTAEIQGQGESGILGSLAATLEEFFSVILTLKLQWSINKDIEATVALNKEYMKNTVAPEMMKDLVSAVQSGKMSFKTFYYNISKLDMYPAGWTEEQEQEAIENEALGAASMEMFTAIDSLNKQVAELKNGKTVGKSTEKDTAA